ncbi:MAG: tripartite tricarboxylate transporter TctB family protein [Burkholderiaceae bacterium]
MSRLARRIIGLFTLMAAGGVALGIQGIDGAGGYSGLSPRFLPGLVAAGLALCGALLLAGGTGSLARRDAGDANASRERLEEETPRFAGQGAALWMLGGLIIHMIVIQWIGFVAASVFLLACVARGHGSRRPARDALVGLLLSLPVWWLFARGLGLNLPLFPLLGL